MPAGISRLSRLRSMLSRPLPLLVLGTLIFSFSGPPADAASGRRKPNEDRESAQERAASKSKEPSPARRLDRRRTRAERPSPPPEADFRAIDGRFNHPDDEDRGAAHTELFRRFPSDYADEVSTLAGENRPSARAISNAVHAQTDKQANGLAASDYLWQWGQFLDHDIDLTEGATPAEPAPIPVPEGDPEFDPDRTGDREIAFSRSIWSDKSGGDPGNPRQQLNEITAWIDASNVYGSNEERALALRTLDGTGRLATSEGNLLPFNTQGLPNAGGSGPELFLAGDVRANEQVGLTALHTLFMREHNRLARRLARRHPDWSGEQIYQKARQLVGAEMQAITYREFLPALLGKDALTPYRGYDEDVDASIANAFSTAAYRFGHSALSPSLLRLDARGKESKWGPLPLRNAFFAPERLISEGGIAPLLRGLAAQKCQAIDARVIDDVRNFLFGQPGSGGFDLASLNIQRGRDHGLPSYNAVREALGFPVAGHFEDIHPDPDVHGRLASVYEKVDDVDLWTGGLSEPRFGNGHLGETFRAIVIDQFEALRDGDRLWYERVLTPREIRWIERRTLWRIIRSNTEIRRELPRDIWHAKGSPGKKKR